MHEANEQAKVANRRIADAESKAAAAKEMTIAAKREYERAEELKRHAQEGEELSRPRKSPRW